MSTPPLTGVAEAKLLGSAAPQSQVSSKIWWSWLTWLKAPFTLTIYNSINTSLDYQPSSLSQKKLFLVEHLSYLSSLTWGWGGDALSFKGFLKSKRLSICFDPLLFLQFETALWISDLIIIKHPVSWCCDNFLLDLAPLFLPFNLAKICKGLSLKNMGFSYPQTTRLEVWRLCEATKWLCHLGWVNLPLCVFVLPPL